MTFEVATAADERDGHRRVPPPNSIAGEVLKKKLQLKKNAIPPPAFSNLKSSDTPLSGIQRDRDDDFNDHESYRSNISRPARSSETFSSTMPSVPSPSIVPTTSLDTAKPLSALEVVKEMGRLLARYPQLQPYLKYRLPLERKGNGGDGEYSFPHSSIFYEDACEVCLDHNDVCTFDKNDPSSKCTACTQFGGRCIFRNREGDRPSLDETHFVCLRCKMGGSPDLRDRSKRNRSIRSSFNLPCSPSEILRGKTVEAIIEKELEVKRKLQERWKAEQRIAARRDVEQRLEYQRLEQRRLDLYWFKEEQRLLARRLREQQLRETSHTQQHSRPLVEETSSITPHTKYKREMGQPLAEPTYMPGQTRPQRQQRVPGDSFFDHSFQPIDTSEMESSVYSTKREMSDPTGSTTPSSSSVDSLTSKDNGKTSSLSSFQEQYSLTENSKGQNPKEIIEEASSDDNVSTAPNLPISYHGRENGDSFSDNLISNLNRHIVNDLHMYDSQHYEPQAKWHAAARHGYSDTPLLSPSKPSSSKIQHDLPKHKTRALSEFETNYNKTPPGPFPAEPSGQYIERNGKIYLVPTPSASSQPVPSQRLLPQEFCTENRSSPYYGMPGDYLSPRPTQHRLDLQLSSSRPPPPNPFSSPFVALPPPKPSPNAFHAPSMPYPPPQNSPPLSVPPSAPHQPNPFPGISHSPSPQSPPPSLSTPAPALEPPQTNPFSTLFGAPRNQRLFRTEDSAENQGDDTGDEDERPRSPSRPWRLLRPKKEVPDDPIIPVFQPKSENSLLLEQVRGIAEKIYIRQSEDGLQAVSLEKGVREMFEMREAKRQLGNGFKEAQGGEVIVRMMRGEDEEDEERDELEKAIIDPAGFWERRLKEEHESMEGKFWDYHGKKHR